MLLAADTMQDVYGTARSWTDDAMHGAGFTGDWSKLDLSYRLPRRAQLAARDFAKSFLPRDIIDLPDIEQGSLEIEKCTLQWVQCAPHRANKECVDAILAMMRETGQNGLANADITFICNDIDFGRNVTNELETYSDGETPIHTVHTFDTDEREGRRRKMGFYMGDARIKATTLHSFKGWESRLLVVHVGHADGGKDMASIYAALTRLKRSPPGSWLTVVCSAPELAAYGSTWNTNSDVARSQPDDRNAPGVPPSDSPTARSSGEPMLVEQLEITESLAELPWFGLRPDDEVPLNILRCVRLLLAGTDIAIKDIGHHQYQEAYFFDRKGAIARLNIYYKSTGKVTRVHPVKKDDLSDQLASLLLPLTIADLPVAKIATEATVPKFSRLFLDAHYSAVKFNLQGYGIIIAGVNEGQWHQRYTFVRDAERAVVDYFYGGAGVFTTCHPVAGSFSSTEFVREILKATENLALVVPS